MLSRLTSQRSGGFIYYRSIVISLSALFISFPAMSPLPSITFITLSLPDTIIPGIRSNAVAIHSSASAIRLSVLSTSMSYDYCLQE